MDSDHPDTLDANPSTNPPHIPSPSEGTRCASTRFFDPDPILRDLSPTLTLRAFGQNRNASPRTNTFAKFFETASDSRRSLGAKAAQVCLDVRSWSKELEAWEWPGTFEKPEPATKRQRTNGYGDDSMQTDDANQVDGEVEYCGSLPAQVVKACEQRADEIEQSLDDVDVEELKEFVLAAHHEAGMGNANIDDSIGTIGAATDLGNLDDYTAIVTATILQALPYLSRLKRLLDVWNIRLWVLRQVPDFLQDLKDAYSELGAAWNTVRQDHGYDVGLGGSDVAELQRKLEDRITHLGRRLDGLLDDLEGRTETVPMRWIEDFEHLEQEYANWRVKAEQSVLNYELAKIGAQQENNRPAEINLIARFQSSVAHHLSLDIAVELEQTTSNGQATSKLITAQLSASPHLDGGDVADVAKPATSAGPHKENIHDSLSADRPLPTADLDGQQPADPGHESPEADKQVNNASTMNTPSVSSHSPDKTTEGNILPLSREDGPKLGVQPHHVPIVTTNFSDVEDYPAERVAGDVRSRSISAGDSPGVSVLKKRMAFLADAERTDSLQRASKTPVRSFEHASTAFTRLFKKEKSTEHPRTASSGAHKSPVDVRSRSVSLNLRRGDDGVVWGRPSADASSRRTSNGTRSATPAMDDSPLSAKAEAPSPYPLPQLPEQMRRELQSSNARITQEQSSGSLLSSTDTDDAHTRTSSNIASVQDRPLVSSSAALSPALHTPVQECAPVFVNQDEAPESMDSSLAISSPEALKSNAIDRMFADSLPKSPDDSALLFRCQHDPRIFDAVAFKLRQATEPLVEQGDVAFGDDRIHDTAKQAGSRLEKRHSHLLDGLPQTPELSKIISTVTRPDDVVDDSSPESPLSAISSPEIRDASVGYFPIQVLSSSRPHSVIAASPIPIKSSSTPTRSPMDLRLETPSPEGEQSKSFDKPQRIDRASFTRIQSHHGSELNSIEFSRRSLVSSRYSVSPSTLERVSSASSTPDLATAPGVPHGREPSLSRVYGTHEAVNGSQCQLSSPEASPIRSEAIQSIPSSPVAPRESSPAAQTADLNAYMSKRRQSLNVIVRPPTRNTAHKTPVDGDSFDRHVSEVIEALPARIRFRSRAETPQSPRTWNGPRPKTPRLVSHTKAGSLTLAPAEKSAKQSQNASDPEVKLYHLTQAGKEEQPIKLFVRLVGENERVMVRVGGGWADLKDYLKQYAEHHGSRTVSEGSVDVQTMPTASASARKVSSTTTSRATPNPTATAPRPSSKDSAFTSSPSPEPPLRTPISTPGKTSRPSTSSSSNSQSTSRAAANGSGKKPDLPEHKAKWVEGMLERVTKASAEKNQAGKEKKMMTLGEIGKVGSTRRVVFRSPSAMEGSRGKG